MSENHDSETPFRAGLVTLLGKPNVGKSTLLNRMVGQKVSIVSDKPQTTRRRVIGIVNGSDYQIAFIDTPGIHEPHTKLGRAMVEAARKSLADIDCIVYVADGSKKPDEEDKQIAKLVTSGQKLPVIVCINKMDLLKADNVQPFVDEYCRLFSTEDYMLTTATRGDNVSKLLEIIVANLPEGERQFPEDEFTDQSSRFMSAEFVREKILLATRQEVPHATAVLVDSWEDDPDLTRIHASIIVEKPSQRAILIGKGGSFLKRIGTEARREIEEMLDRRIYLELHVRVQEEWRQNPRVLHELEYSE